MIAAYGLYVFQPHPPQPELQKATAMYWALGTISLLSPTLASGADMSKSSRRINGHRSQQKKQPSVAEVRRAIGIADGPLRNAADSSSGSSSPSFMDMLSSTPIGQAEGPAERKLRELAEWVTDQTEANGRAGQQILLIMCLKILPVWLFLLLVAYGVIKLPFDLPFLDDLIS